MLFADQSPLKKRLNQVGRKKRWLSRLLVFPALCFLVFFFLIPLGDILCKSIINPEIHKNLPKTLVALRSWDGQQMPSEDVFEALVEDLRQAREKGMAGAISRRLGYEGEQYSAMLNATLHALSLSPSMPARALVIGASPLWAEPDTWHMLLRVSPTLTPYYMLAIFDHKIDLKTGQIVAVDKNQALYVTVLFRTLWMALVITFWCVIIGYPLAYWLACQPKKRAMLLLILVLLPFWTSLLVRTTGWFILLQSNGFLNYLLLKLHVIDRAIAFVPSRVGVYIAMVHILLPFIILPLYAVMTGISPSHKRAAISLGAHPFYAFWTVYVPQTYMGLRAGILLVFIMTIGYYITPSLLGTPGDQMLSYFVAYYTNSTNNWGMAAALSIQLIIIVVLLSWVYSKMSYKSNGQR